MRSSRPITTRQRGWLFGVIALLAMAAQLVVAMAPLAEGRDRSMASHVESTGAKGHYTHNDATCAACQARSIHGTTSRQSVEPLTDVLVPTRLVRGAERVVETSLHPKDNPRAPPVVI
jgi:hypothetical protein